MKKLLVLIGILVLLVACAPKPQMAPPQPVMAPPVEAPPIEAAPPAASEAEPMEEKNESMTEPEEAEGEEYKVDIKGFAFSPAVLMIKKGDKVTWTNMDSAPHTATADDKSFDTGHLAPGDTKTLTFDKPGVYTYHCAVHPNMKAKIIVQ